MPTPEPRPPRKDVMQTEHIGPSLRLRPLEDDDLDAVVRLIRSTPNYHSAAGFGQQVSSKLQLQSEFVEVEDSPDRALYAIERRDDRTLLGFADVRLESTMSDTATIAFLVIGGPYQQQGYGSEAADLLEHALFADPEVEFVLAGVSDSSVVGQRFWQRRGYEFSGSTTHDPQSSRATLWLAKARKALAT